MEISRRPWATCASAHTPSISKEFVPWCLAGASCASLYVLCLTENHWKLLELSLFAPSLQIYSNLLITSLLSFLFSKLNQLSQLSQHSIQSLNHVQVWYNQCCVEKKRITSLILLAVFCPMHPRISLASCSARVHFWFMFDLVSTRMPRSTMCDSIITFHPLFRLLFLYFILTLEMRTN